MSSWFSDNRHLYPENWDEIAKAIKTAAGWRCLACGAPHGPSPNMLTVDHLDHNPGNCDPSNLIALCQRCHMRRHNLYPPAQTKDEAIQRLATRARLENLQLSFWE